MSNGELQPQKRRSRIHKGIERTLNTDKYESIVIRDFIDEEIEWTTLEERDEKIENWENIFLARFKTYHDKTLKDAGLEHKVAYSHNSYAERLKPARKQVTEISGLLEELEGIDSDPVVKDELDVLDTID